MNKLFLIGNLTKNPNGGETSNGKTYAKLSVAVNRPYTDNGDKITDFFNVTVWRNAENCLRYLEKGSKVAIVGSIQNRSYEDKDGVKRTVTDIVAEDVEFLSRRVEESQTVGEQEPINEEDLPF